jgi:hypothetical protein
MKVWHLTTLGPNFLFLPFLQAEKDARLLVPSIIQSQIFPLLPALCSDLRPSSCLKTKLKTLYLQETLLGSTFCFKKQSSSLPSAPNFSTWWLLEPSLQVSTAQTFILILTTHDRLGSLLLVPSRNRATKAQKSSTYSCYPWIKTQASASLGQEHYPNTYVPMPFFLHGLTQIHASPKPPPWTLHWGWTNPLLHAPQQTASGSF